jgi:hypothetical protein
MGVHNIKFETEVFQQVPQFQIPSATPVETKADPTQLLTISSQIAQLTATVNQLTQVVAGQAFTRAAPQAAAVDTLNTADELRKLGQRLDDIEARVPKAKEAAKV